ncbi:MAG TPA: TetR/AcrR family transcriptional regulator [Candidatus Binataceae bacterium]|nr:TetR/AcrR family transcriptional regulator [Candidatus Binataceae bacterium]
MKRKPQPSRSGAKGRARRLDQTERRAQLLQCAMHVFARRGLGSARHAEIAREAGVSVPAVFFYFPNREELVMAVLAEVDRFLMAMAEEIHARDRPAPETILAHAQAFAASVETHPDYARVWLDWSTAIREEIWPRYLDFQERMVAIIARTIRRWHDERGKTRDTEVEDDARLIVGSAHMIAQMKFTRVAPEKVDHFLRTLVHAALGDTAQSPPA